MGPRIHLQNGVIVFKVIAYNLYPLKVGFFSTPVTHLFSAIDRVFVTPFMTGFTRLSSTPREMTDNLMALELGVFAGFWNCVLGNVTEILHTVGN